MASGDGELLRGQYVDRETGVTTPYTQQMVERPRAEALVGTNLDAEVMPNDAAQSMVRIRNDDGSSLTGAVSKTEYFFDEARGSVKRVTVAVTASGVTAATVTESAGTVTEITYKPYSDTILLRITETWTIPGPTVTTIRYEQDSGAKVQEARTLTLAASVTPSESISGTSLIVTESKPSGIAALIVFKVVTTYYEATAHDSASAIVEEEDRPFQYVGRLNFNYRPTSALVDMNIGDIGTAGVGIAASTARYPANPQAQLTKHTIKTWWVNATTKPSISFDEVQPRSITFTDGTTTASFSNVIFDQFTLYFDVPASNVTIPATTPDFTTYHTTWIGVSKIVDGSVKQISNYRWKVTTVSVVMR